MNEIPLTLHPDLPRQSRPATRRLRPGLSPQRRPPPLPTAPGDLLRALLLPHTRRHRAHESPVCALPVARLLCRVSGRGRNCAVSQRAKRVHVRFPHQVWRLYRVEGGDWQGARGRWDDGEEEAKRKMWERSLNVPKPCRQAFKGFRAKWMEGSVPDDGPSTRVSESHSAGRERWSPALFSCDQSCPHLSSCGRAIARMPTG